MIQLTKFIGPLCDEFAVKIIEELNYYTKLFYQNRLENPLEQENELIIYFATTGGEVCIADLLTDCFTVFNKTDKLTLVAFKEISSAGFKLFNDYSGPKRLIDDTVAIVHLHTMDITSRDLENKGSIPSVLLDNMKERYELILDTYPINKVEKALLRRGGDIVLTHDRLKKIFK